MLKTEYRDSKVGKSFLVGTMALKRHCNVQMDSKCPKLHSLRSRRSSKVLSALQSTKPSFFIPPFRHCTMSLCFLLGLTFLPSIASLTVEPSTEMPTAAADAATTATTAAAATIPTASTVAPKVFPTLPKAYSVSVNARFNDKVFQFTEEVDVLLEKAVRRYFPSSSSSSSFSSSSSSSPSSYPREELFTFKPSREQLHVIEGRNCSRVSLSNQEAVRQKLLVPDLRFLLVSPSRVATSNFRNHNEFFLPPSTDIFHYEGKQENTLFNLTLDWWSASISQSETTYKIDFYFYESEGQSVPFLVKLKGERRYGERQDLFDFDIAYSFFQAKQSLSESRFQTPPGVFCPRSSNAGVIDAYKPEIPRIFSVKSESTTGQEVSFYEDHFDYTDKLYRRDFQPSTHLEKLYGKDRLILIQDFNQTVEYYLDDVNKNCSGPLKLKSASSAARNIGTRDVTMHSPHEIFQFDATDWVYVGKRTAREMEAHVWIDKTEKPLLNITTEIYMKAEGSGDNWPDLKQNTPLKLYRRREQAGAESEELSVQFFDFRSGAPPYGTFDVSDCYPERQKMDLVFRVQSKLVNFLGDHGNRSDEAKKLLGTDISSWIGMPSSRIANIHFDAVEVDRETIVDIWFTLLAAPMVNGEMLTSKYPDLEGAFKKLKGLISAFPPQYFYTIDKRRVSVIPGTLATNQETLDPRKVRLTEEMIGYTGGAMIGLGLGMFLIGSLLGVALAYGMWRFSQDGPQYSIF